MKFATFLGSSPIIRSAERVNFHLLVHASPSHRKSPITIHALRNSRGAVDSLAQSPLLLIRQRARTCTCDGPVHLAAGLLIVREALANHGTPPLSPIHPRRLTALLDRLGADLREGQQRAGSHGLDSLQACGPVLLLRAPGRSRSRDHGLLVGMPVPQVKGRQLGKALLASPQPFRLDSRDALAQAGLLTRTSPAPPVP